MGRLRQPAVASVIPPRRVAPPFRAPYVNAGVYVNEQLGVFSPIPWGFSVDLSSPTSVSIAREGAPPAAAGIELSQQIAVQQTIDEVHGALAAAVKKAIGDRELDHVGGQAVSLPGLDSGVDRAWRLGGGSAGMRAIVVPICRGTGSLVLWQIWSDPTALSAVQQWLSGIQRTANGDPPICGGLDP